MKNVIGLFMCVVAAIAFFTVLTACIYCFVYGSSDAACGFGMLTFVFSIGTACIFSYVFEDLKP